MLVAAGVIILHQYPDGVRSQSPGWSGPIRRLRVDSGSASMLVACRISCCAHCCQDRMSRMGRGSSGSGYLPVALEPGNSSRARRVVPRAVDLTNMTDVTRILSAIEQGDPDAADQLLPLVYDELRQLAAHKLANEKPGQTLQATALVHEAYLRLVDVEQAQQWNSRGHFFGAAAEAMRRILVESARRKRSRKHGGGLRRLNLDA